MPALRVPFLLLSLLYTGIACSDASRLDQLYNRILRELNRPLYPGPLNLPTPMTLQKRMAFLDAAAEDLHKIAFSSLQPFQKDRYATLRQQLAQATSEVRTLQEDPSAYHFFEAMATPLPTPPFSEETIGRMIPLLQKIPPYYMQARQNLSSPRPDGCRKAVSGHLSAIAVLHQVLEEAEVSTLATAQKSALGQSCEKALLAVKDYIAWCNSQAFEKGNPAQFAPNNHLKN